MLPASTNGGGQCAIFPDVCKNLTPGGPVPMPYPNMRPCSHRHPEAACSSKVKIIGKKTVVKGTGNHHVQRRRARHRGWWRRLQQVQGTGQVEKEGSSKVKAEGKEVCQRHVDGRPNGGSNANRPAGVQVAPSQTKVTVMP